MKISKNHCKVLITGSNRQVGKTLKLIDPNYTYLNKSDFDLDVFKSKDFNKFKDYDILINLAAKTDLKLIESNKKEAYKTNVLGLKKIISICKKYNIFLIHLSSDYIYKDSKIRKKENFKKNIYNYYGYTKLIGEELIKKNLSNYIILRTSNIFSNYGNNLLNKIYKYISEKRKFSFYDNIHYNPTSSISIAKLIAKLIIYVEKKKFKYYGIYNYAQEPATTPYIFAKSILNELKVNTKNLISINYNNDSNDIIRPYNTTLNSDKINKLIKLNNKYWLNDLSKYIKQRNETI